MKFILVCIFLAIHPEKGPVEFKLRMDFESMEYCEIVKDRLDKSPPPPNLIMIGSYCQKETEI